MFVLFLKKNRTVVKFFKTKQEKSSGIIIRLSDESSSDVFSNQNFGKNLCHKFGMKMVWFHYGYAYEKQDYTNDEKPWNKLSICIFFHHYGSAYDFCNYHFDGSLFHKIHKHTV